MKGLAEKLKGSTVKPFSSYRYIIQHINRHNERLNSLCEWYSESTYHSDFTNDK